MLRLAARGSKRCGISMARTFSSTKSAKSGLAPAALSSIFAQNGIDTFYGVPDSLLKDICAYISDNTEGSNHIIAANEGTACGLAAGYHMATGKIPCVYLQNSGLGNVVNPVMSLAHPRVYGIPMLMLIGWRGEPGVKDEPQHNFMGESTTAILDSMKVEYCVMPTNEDDAKVAIQKACEHMTTNQAPYAMLVQKGAFEKYKLQTNLVPHLEGTMKREAAIKLVADALGDDVAMVSATGMPSRELYEHRVERNGVEGAAGRDFLTVGSMGCCSSIALGLSLGAPGKQVVCLDGDGGTIMHLGALVTNGQRAPANFKHVILNNAAHDSVGGQPSHGFDVDLPAMAKSAGYKGARVAVTAEEIQEGCRWLSESDGPVLLEVKIQTGARSDLGRPKSSPGENKVGFMKHVASLPARM